MMKRLRALTTRYASVRTSLVILLCLGAFASILVQSTTAFREDIRRNIRFAAMYADDSPLTAGTWEYASAHANTLVLVRHLQRSLEIDSNALLLVAGYTSPGLALVLPLMGLFTSLALVRRKVLRRQSAARRSWLLCRGILFLGIFIIGGLVLLRESAILEIPFSWGQWSRVLVWLVYVVLYFSAFLFLGGWISRRVEHIRTAAWIFLVVFVGLFMLQNSRGFVMRFDGSLLPPVPELPHEVRLSLFRPSGEPRVTLDREEMVADYLASVDAYSEAVHDVVSHRYKLERWWHAVSPHLLLDECSTQLLQTLYANTVDVLHTPDAGNPSLGASLAAIWPETAWLILLCSLSGLGAWIAARRQVGAP